MSREVRRVPKNWEHPKRKNGNYIPLYGGSFHESLAEWQKGKSKWDEGLRENWFSKNEEDKWKPRSEDELNMSFEEWSGQIPKEKYYMPEWKDNEKTHLQMYETTSEGTPISPVIEDPKELARWLVDNEASAFGQSTASYDSWLSTIERGFAFSAVFDTAKGIISGVEGMNDQD